MGFQALSETIEKLNLPDHEWQPLTEGMKLTAIFEEIRIHK